MPSSIMPLQIFVALNEECFLPLSRKMACPKPLVSLTHFIFIALCDQLWVLGMVLFIWTGVLGPPVSCCTCRGVYTLSFMEQFPLPLNLRRPSLYLSFLPSFPLPLYSFPFFPFPAPLLYLPFPLFSISSFPSPFPKSSQGSGGAVSFPSGICGRAPAEN